VALFFSEHMSMEMTDEELVRAFESVTLPVSAFDHAAHVRVGWWYLRHYPLGGAIDRFREAIRGFAEANGAGRKYHETITVVYMLAIAERLADSRTLNWPDFAARNPDLFERTPSIVERYYSRAMLDSERARATFVMPDR
jgi:hypothetical protein